MKLPPTESDQSDVPLLSPPVVFNPFFVWLLRETECAGAAPELQLRPTLKGQLEHDTVENPVMRMPFLTQMRHTLFNKADAAVAGVTKGWLVFASDQKGAPMREGMPLR
ncbi:uncharacterized protein LOC142818058 [Rhipicephalus microplus]|uniref:uncharacterized protein LOC142818058 n=1 Tax=Rhipicephalus microplus TaxID=6941 RepID=UPI003F6D355A